MSTKRIYPSIFALFLICFFALTNKRVVGQEAQTQFLHYLTWNPLDDQLVSSSTAAYDANMTIYGLITLQNQGIENLPAMGEVYDVAYSPDGRRLAIANGGVLKIFDIEANSILFESPDNSVPIIAISWSPDSTRLTTLHSSPSLGNQELNIWTVEPLKSAFAYDPGSIWHLAWSPTENQIAMMSVTRLGLFLMDIETAIETQQSDARFIGREFYASPYGSPVEWDPTGTTVAVAMDDGAIAFFDIASGEEVGTLVSGHTEGMTALAFSPDGALLASASNDGTVHVYNVNTRELVASYEKGTHAVPRRIAFSPFGGRLAFGSTVQSEHLGPGELFVEELNTRVVVPVVSVERLHQVAAACEAHQPVPSLESLNIDAMTTDMLPEFISSLRALPGDSIHPSCRGDLLAIAEGLMQ